MVRSVSEGRAAQRLLGHSDAEPLDVVEFGIEGARQPGRHRRREGVGSDGRRMSALNGRVRTRRLEGEEAENV